MEARVPRYFFNVHDGQSELDVEGSEFDTNDAARLTAVQLAGEILRDEGHRQKLGDAWYVEVLDDAGGLVCSVDVRVSPSTGEGRAPRR